MVGTKKRGRPPGRERYEEEEEEDVSDDEERDLKTSKPSTSSATASRRTSTASRLSEKESEKSSTDDTAPRPKRRAAFFASEVMYHISNPAMILAEEKDLQRALVESLREARREQRLKKSRYASQPPAIRYLIEQSEKDSNASSQDSSDVTLARGASSSTSSAGVGSASVVGSVRPLTAAMKAKKSHSMKKFASNSVPFYEHHDSDHRIHNPHVNPHHAKRTANHGTQCDPRLNTNNNNNNNLSCHPGTSTSSSSATSSLKNGHIPVPQEHGPRPGTSGRLHGPSTKTAGASRPTQVRELFPHVRPSTEDLITFLCLRGSPNLPPTLDFAKLNEIAEKEKVEKERQQRKAEEEVESKMSADAAAATAAAKATTIDTPDIDQLLIPKSEPNESVRTVANNKPHAISNSHKTEVLIKCSSSSISSCSSVSSSSSISHSSTSTSLSTSSTFSTSEMKSLDRYHKANQNKAGSVQKPRKARPVREAVSASSPFYLYDIEKLLSLQRKMIKKNKKESKKEMEDAKSPSPRKINKSPKKSEPRPVSKVKNGSSPRESDPLIKRIQKIKQAELQKQQMKKDAKLKAKPSTSNHGTLPASAKSVSEQRPKSISDLRPKSIVGLGPRRINDVRRDPRPIGNHKNANPSILTQIKKKSLQRHNHAQKSRNDSVVRTDRSDHKSGSRTANGKKSSDIKSTRKPAAKSNETTTKSGKVTNSGRNPVASKPKFKIPKPNVIITRSRGKKRH